MASGYDAAKPSIMVGPCGSSPQPTPGPVPVAPSRKHEVHAQFERAEASDRDDPSHHLEGEDLGRILDQALDRIAPDQRAVLILNVVEQMDYESIAAALRIPIGTVRSRMNRARVALRELLLETLPEEYHARPPGRRTHP